MTTSRHPNAPCPPRNPHCQGETDVSIQSDFMVCLLVAAIFAYVWWIFKKHKV